VRHWTAFETRRYGRLLKVSWKDKTRHEYCRSRKNWQTSHDWYRPAEEAINFSATSAGLWDSKMLKQIMLGMTNGKKMTSKIREKTEWWHQWPVKTQLRLPPAVCPADDRGELMDEESPPSHWTHGPRWSWLTALLRHRDQTCDEDKMLASAL